MLDSSRTANDGGAITIVGLGAGCFLVGTMWWTVGIGRACMLHDKLQETSDAMAAAGSTVHARGMNLIGTINLVMLALVAVFIIMSIIADVLHVGVIGVAVCAATLVGAPVCGPMLASAQSAETTVSGIRDGYLAVMRPTITVMSYVQTGVAVVMPLSAQVASIRTALRYDEVGFSFSPSLLPGGAPGVDVGASGPSLPSFKLGLPVAQEKMGKLCEIAGAYSANWMRRALGKIPAIGLILELPGIRAIVSKAIGAFATGVRARYCSGGIWEEPGPKQIWGPTKNGSEWTQNWSFVLNKGRVDPNEHLVSIGTYRYVVGEGGKISMPNFFTQSEMFFDCDGKWDAPTCNGPGKKAYDYTLYGLKWRSRLRRFHPPSFGNLLGGAVGDFLGSGGLSKYIGGSVTDVGPFQDLQSFASGFGGEYGQAAADDAFGWLAGKADAEIGSVRGDLLGKVKGGGNGPTSLILH